MRQERDPTRKIGTQQEEIKEREPTDETKLIALDEITEEIKRLEKEKKKGVPSAEEKHAELTALRSKIGKEVEWGRKFIPRDRTNIEDRYSILKFLNAREKEYWSKAKKEKSPQDTKNL